MSPSPFRIIPAIDLLDTKVVRLYQGNYDKVTVYNSDPVRQAQKFLEAGAKLLHLVDLNAARSGQRQKNRRIIAKICKALRGTVQVELGGGLRSAASLRECFESGIERCVIGTAAIKDPDFLERALKDYGPERIIVGVDAREARVHVSGWEEASSFGVMDFLHHLEQKGLSEVIFTDIARDGTLSGPGKVLDAYIDSCKLNFILSGGLSSIEDLKSLLNKRHPRLTGAISGRALYEKKLDLTQAIQLCKTH